MELKIREAKISKVWHLFLDFNFSVIEKDCFAYVEDNYSHSVNYSLP